jgi:hypothetical protein
MEQIKDLFIFWEESVVEAGSVSSNQLSVLFRNLVCNGNSQLLSDDRLAIANVEVTIDPDGYQEFERRLCSISESEREWLSLHYDQLIPQRKRRTEGIFYTPTKLVTMSHNSLAQQLGADWKEKYVVWDPAAGSRNLTRDYQFSELYSSTLEETDISEAVPNQNEVVFKFDFLDDQDDKLPAGLLTALQQNKPLLFYLNPPYSRFGSCAQRIGSYDKKINYVWRHMRSKGIGDTISEMYIQFMLRIVLYVRRYKLTNVAVGLFCPCSYLGGTQFVQFRRMWCSTFAFQNAIAFSASAFPGLEALWAIHFSVWKSGQTAAISKFRHKFVQVEDNGELTKPIEKDIYNFDDGTFKILTKDWFRCKEEASFNTMICVYSNFEIKNPVTAKLCKSIRIPKDFLGSCNLTGAFVIRNRVPYFGRTFCILYSSLGGDTHITPNNFDRVISSFATLYTTHFDMIDNRDCLHVPNDLHPNWDRYVSDCIVFSLCSARAWFIAKYDIQVNRVLYQVPNEMFWLSRDRVAELAKSCGNNETLRTLEIVPHERYVQGRIKEIEANCSDMGRELLSSLTTLVESTFKFRESFDKEHPAVGVSAWDAGWRQLTAMCQVVAADRLNEVRRLRREFGKQLGDQHIEMGWRAKRVF